MQQTETYKLNLIESDDPFSPEALNDNARTVEAALVAKADAAQLARVEGSVETVSTAVPKFACGSYSGDSTKNRKIELGFMPKMVYLGGFMGFCKQSSKMGQNSPQSIPAEKLVRNGLVVLKSVAVAGHIDDFVAVD